MIANASRSKMYIPKLSEMKVSIWTIEDKELRSTNN